MRIHYQYIFTIITLVFYDTFEFRYQNPKSITCCFDPEFIESKSLFIYCCAIIGYGLDAVALTSGITFFTTSFIFECKHRILKFCFTGRCTIDNVCKWVVRDYSHSFSILACLILGNKQPCYFK